jgi:uncharacterized membrane protein
LDSANIHSGATRNPWFSGATGGFFLAGTCSLVLSLWTNPAAFGKSLAWLPSHTILGVLGVIVILAGARIVKLERRIAQLELQA